MAAISCKMLFLLSVLYTALGHFLDQKGLWDPCIGQITYKKSFTTESYLGGRALRCSIKEDYFCLVPGYSGAQVSTGVHKNSNTNNRMKGRVERPHFLTPRLDFRRAAV